MYRLTDDEKNRLMSKLHHYLQDHKYKNKLSNEDLAKEMSVDLEELNNMLTGKPYRPLVEAVEIMMTLGILKKKYGQNPGDLLDWLFNKVDTSQSMKKEIDEYNKKNGRSGASASEEFDGVTRKDAIKKLYPWEQTLLRSFDFVGIPLRKRFIEFCEESHRHGGEDLKKILAGAVATKNNVNSEIMQ